jgi:hypothetical protein
MRNFPPSHSLLPRRRISQANSREPGRHLSESGLAVEKYLLQTNRFIARLEVPVQIQPFSASLRAISAIGNVKMVIGLRLPR